MKMKKGFTLVELLAVMAIISILSAIAIPNIIGYIARGRVTNAIATVAGIELSVTGMLSAAGRSSVNEFFNPCGVRAALGSPCPDPNDLPWPAPQDPFWRLTGDQFNRAQELYTNTMYALLISGRGALNPNFGESVIAGSSATYADVLRHEVVKKLGTSYMPDLGLDPWGSLYNIYPGPWPRSTAIPILFRTYLDSEADTGVRIPGQRGLKSDGGTKSVFDPDTELTESVGFPAQRAKNIFIWSVGKNLISGQLIYDGDDDSYRYIEQEELFIGGGDDINNWDKTQSWSRHY